jgi:hypothetical protein
MNNINLVIKPDETMNDIIEQICLSEDIGYDDPFAFSAIMVRNKTRRDYFDLKINCIEPQEDNPYTPLSLIEKLFSMQEKENGIRCVVAPLEQYLTVHRPMLLKMTNKVYPRYQKLIPDKEDLLSTLFLVIVKLNNKGYYLHNRLIYKTFINELNMEVRKIKYYHGNIQSLDAPIGCSEDGEPICLLDQLECPISTEEARQLTHYTEADYREDLFNEIKSAMLEKMSELSFERILIQLGSKTVDTRTSRMLSKVREELNPGYIPRPNARGKSKGGKR